MSEEKQIEEMADELSKVQTVGLVITESQMDSRNSYSREIKNKEVAEHLYNAGYRKQSENVIELPCKVGDAMYVTYKGIAYPVRVNAIRIDTKKNNHRVCVSGTFHLYGDYDHNYKATFPFDSIGKSLFYTEAEAKMKGGGE